MLKVVIFAVELRQLANATADHDRRRLPCTHGSVLLLECVDEVVAPGSPVVFATATDLRHSLLGSQLVWRSLRHLLRLQEHLHLVRELLHTAPPSNPRVDGAHLEQRSIDVSRSCHDDSDNKTPNFMGTVTRGEDSQSSRWRWLRC